MKLRNPFKKITSHLLLEQLGRLALACTAILPLPIVTPFIAFRNSRDYKALKKEHWDNYDLPTIEDTHPIYAAIDKIKTRNGITEDVLVFENDTYDLCTMSKSEGIYYITISHALTKVFSEKDWEGIIAHELSHGQHNDSAKYQDEAALLYTSYAMRNWAEKLEKIGSKILELPYIAMTLPAFAPEAFIAGAAAWFTALKYSSDATLKLELLTSRQREMIADETALELTETPDIYRNAIITANAISDFEERGLYIIELEEDPEDLDAYVKGTEKRAKEQDHEAYFAKSPFGHSLLFIYQNVSSLGAPADSAHPSFEQRIKI